MMRPVVRFALFPDQFDCIGTIDYGTSWIRKNIPSGGSIFEFEELLEPIHRAFDPLCHWPLSDGKTLGSLADWIILWVPNMYLYVLSAFQCSLKCSELSEWHFNNLNIGYYTLDISSHLRRWRSAHRAPVAVPSMRARAADFWSRTELARVWACESVVVHNFWARRLASGHDSGLACFFFRQKRAWSLTVKSLTYCFSRISWSVVNVG